MSKSEAKTKNLDGSLSIEVNGVPTKFKLSGRQENDDGPRLTFTAGDRLITVMLVYDEFGSEVNLSESETDTQVEYTFDEERWKASSGFVTTDFSVSKRIESIIRKVSGPGGSVTLDNGKLSIAAPPSKQS